MAFQVSTQTVSEASPDDGTAAAATTIFRGLGRFDEVIIDAVLTGATGDTLDVYLQRAVDVDGTTVWVDWYHFAQIAGAASAIRRLVHSGQATATAPVTVGADAVPALAVNTLACPHPGDQVRVYFVPGGSTSAGATQTISLTGICRRGQNVDLDSLV